jgi:hypothetical protein
MKTYEQLKAELNEAKKQVYALENELTEISDGFIYHTCVLSYGSSSWSTANNPHLIQELADTYGDGYDGLVKVYTDNSELDINHYGCLSILTLDELPENRKNISKSEAYVNNIMPKSY